MADTISLDNYGHSNVLIDVRFWNVSTAPEVFIKKQILNDCYKVATILKLLDQSTAYSFTTIGTGVCPESPQKLSLRREPAYSSHVFVFPNPQVGLEFRTESGNNSNPAGVPHLLGWG